MLAALAIASRLTYFSAALLVLAAACVFLAPLIAKILLLASVVLALGVQYHGARLMFDRALFAALYAPDCDTAAFDLALATLTGKAPANPPRSMASRWQGVLRLLRRLLCLFALQIIALLLALLATLR